MRAWWSKVRALVKGRGPIDAGLAEELESHLEMETEEWVERGMTRQEARRAAAARLGNRTAIAERSRETWGFPWLEGLAADVRYGLRSMRRAPGFSLVVILTFALGVGLNTAIFSAVHAVLLKPLPYPAPERLVWFGEATAKAAGISVTWGNFEHWRDDNRTFEGMAAFQFTEQTLTGRAEPLVTRGLVATAQYFGLVGMRPLLGRTLGQEDDRPGAAPAILLNHRFWAGQLGGDPGIVGKTLTLNGNPYEVAGVAAPLWEPWQVDCYLPLGGQAGQSASRSRHGSMRMLGRLKPGVALAGARADLDAIMRRLAEVDPGPENEHRSFGRYLAEYTTRGARGTLVMLMGAALLILLIACANVGNLLLARNTARTGELALRKAIGAGSPRLVRQLLTENLTIAVVGGVAGLGIAAWALRVLVAMAPREIPRLSETALDLPALLFAFGITVAAGLLAGLAPVVLTGRIDLSSALKEGSRNAGAGKRRQAFGNVLVVAEVAFTFVLAFGAGLLVRSLIAANLSDPGFDPQRALAMTLRLPSRTYRGPAVREFYTGLLADLRALPGVTGASAVDCLPGTGSCGDWFYSVPERPAPAQNEVPIALFDSAEAGYFRLMRIPIRQGREFDDTDRAKGPGVAVVNETLARRWWPGRSAVGHRIKVGGPYLEGGLVEIVGVAGDVRQFGLDSPPMAQIYLPAAQQPGSRMAVVVRTAGDPALLMEPVRRRILGRDRDLPLDGFAPVEESLRAGLAGRRFSTALLALFATLAMVLAGVGVYGLLSYWVKSREPEIALRLALGARPGVILRWTSLQAIRLAVIGVALGVPAAWAASRGLQDLVFGIPARSPAALAAAALVVVAIAFAAAALPAWRAARVDAARRLQGA